MDDYYTPEWWDELSKKSLKKKTRLLHKSAKQLNKGSGATTLFQKFFIIGLIVLHIGSE